MQGLDPSPHAHLDVARRLAAGARLAGGSTAERLAAIADSSALKRRNSFASLAARPLKPALSLALAGLIVLAGLLFVRPAPPPPVHKAQTQEALDADRIEKALDDVDMLRQLGTSGGSNSETM